MTTQLRSMSLVGASGVSSLADLTRLERADIMLMDIRMPEVDGIQATHQITADNEFGTLSYTTIS